ncbi:hypothetical protein EJB05_42953, partial [Eragrostis curvula]
MAEGGERVASKQLGASAQRLTTHPSKVNTDFRASSEHRFLSSTSRAKSSSEGKKAESTTGHRKSFAMGGSDVVHTGGCHCRRVRWRAEAPASVAATTCNCSDCAMRGNANFGVPAAKFRLDPGAEESLTTYTFGTHTTKHPFCKVCGITSFYIPRSNPDGVAITVACVDAGTLAHVEYRHVDGKNWEEWFAHQQQHRTE